MGVERGRNGGAHRIADGEGRGGTCEAYTGPERECRRCTRGMDSSAGDKELSKELVEGAHFCA